MAQRLHFCDRASRYLVALEAAAYPSRPHRARPSAITQSLQEREQIILHSLQAAMEEAVGLLVLAPFRDIVSRGNDAIGNGEAGCHDGLVKAAQSLVKEGERALKRIEPLCLIKYEEYGSRFVDALKDDGMALTAHTYKQPTDWRQTRLHS